MFDPLLKLSVRFFWGEDCDPSAVKEDYVIIQTSELRQQPRDAENKQCPEGGRWEKGGGGGGAGGGGEGRVEEVQSQHCDKYPPGKDGVDAETWV